MTHRIIFRKRLAWFIPFGALLSLSVSYGDYSSSTVTVTNRTAHALHITINVKSFADIAPGKSVKTEIKTDKVIINAAYSPGQGESGTFTAAYPTIDLVDPTYLSCNDDHSSSCSQATEPESTARVRTPVNVYIFPDDLR